MTNVETQNEETKEDAEIIGTNESESNNYAQEISNIEYFSLDLDDYSDANQSDIELIKELMNGNNENIEIYIPFEHPHLDAPPANIKDKCSSVLDDGFHFIGRIKVPTHYCHKKMHFVPLKDAFFAWDAEMLQ